MGVYFVAKPNPYFKQGEFLLDSDPGFVQKTVRTGEGPSGFQGLMIPLREVRHCLIKLQKRGLDFRKGGAMG
jgi:hypothetical protein